MVRSVLVGDIGGTNVRFGRAMLNGSGTIEVEDIQTLPGDDFKSFDDALMDYLGTLNGSKPNKALFAFAGPVQGAVVEMTNRNWRIDSQKLESQTGLQQIRLVNDYAAMARGVADLSAEHFRVLHKGQVTDPYAPVLVAGPGTGLGMATLLRDPKHGWQVLTGQGGHAMFSPQTEREWALKKVLHREHGFVSNEVVLAGAGFNTVHRALCELDGISWAETAPQDILDRAAAGDPLAREICELRSAATLGALGDAALLNGTQGGVVITGGVAKRLGDWLAAPRALARFFERGPMKEFMEPMPIRLLLTGEAALIGAAALHFDEDPSE